MVNISNLYAAYNMIILNKHFEARSDPRKGSVLRIQLSDGYFYYLCVTSSTRAWLYRFRTVEPACGSDFFDRSYWGWGMQFFNIVVIFSIVEM